MAQPRFLIAATACLVALAVAIGRGGLGGGGATLLIIALFVLVRSAFRLIDR